MFMFACANLRMKCRLSKIMINCVYVPLVNMVIIIVFVSKTPVGNAFSPTYDFA